MNEPWPEFSWLRDAPDSLLDRFEYQWIAIGEQIDNGSTSLGVIGARRELSELLNVLSERKAPATVFYAFVRPRLEMPDQERRSQRETN